MKTVNQAPEHPANEELAAYVLGNATRNAENIAEHVANCTRCGTLIANTPRETFVGILNKAGTGSTLSGSQESKAISPAGDELPEDLRKQTKYTFLKKLGGGGMGIVYLAEHNLMKRKVAVKLIPPEMIGNPTIKERFLQEVVSAAALEHPNVVRAYATEEFGQHMIYEMEFVDGKDLGEIVKKKGPLPITNAVSYIRQAAQGMQHGMLKGLIHRDIKPNNLMLTRSGTLKVADFGLAKFSRESDKGRDRSLTGVDAMMGTPDYMAPEQARNAKNADIRADIYSLGCTFYYLLTGRPPFEGASITDLIFKHWQDPRPDVSQLRPDVPTELAQFIQKMMAKDPVERPQSPKEVNDDLAKFAKGESLPKKAAQCEPQPKKEADAGVVFVEFTPEPIAETPAKKNFAKWMPVAASLVILLAVGVLFLMKNRKKDPLPKADSSIAVNKASNDEKILSGTAGHPTVGLGANGPSGAVPGGSSEKGDSALPGGIAISGGSTDSGDKISSGIPGGRPGSSSESSENSGNPLPQGRPGGNGGPSMANSPGAASGTPQPEVPLPPALERAKLAYIADRKAHTKEMNDAFDSAIRNAKEGANASAAKKVQLLTDEKNRFTSDGLIPWSRTMRAETEAYFKRERASQTALRLAWQPEIEKARSSGDSDRVRKLDAELKAALDIRLIATWQHSVAGGKPMTASLYSDGMRNGQGDPTTRWVLEGGKLIFYTKTQDPKAGGGQWIDTLTVSDDGSTYAGANQIRVRITGRLVMP